MSSYRTRFARAFLILTVLVTAPAAPAETSPVEDEERILRDAGLASDGPALLAFFHARARMDVDGEHLRRLLTQFVGDDEPRRAAAQAELLGFGALALPALRQAANDLSQPQAAARAADCLAWLEGPASQKLLTAAVHLLAQRKPEGAAAALLTYLPYADNGEIVTAVLTALEAVAAPAGKADPALVQGLSDRQSVRRAAAAVALCRAMPPHQVPELRKLLNDPAAKVRLRAAMALAEAKDAEAISVLLDLLTNLPAAEQQSVEDLLKQLAGEWAPILQFGRDDDLSRGVRRDAWASWWRRSDGPFLLAALAKHTLTADKRRKLQHLLGQLGSADFTIREDASRQLLAFGRLALPRLRETITEGDAEVARRAKMLIERIENGPDVRLPLAALRLLAVRKPAGAVEALLAYLPFAEDEIREEEVRQSLVVLARHDGQLDAALRRGLADAQPKVRIVAAEALIAGGGAEGRAAVRKLLKEDTPSVRLRVALALARAGEREGVSVLIDLLSLLSTKECGEAEEALSQLAGDTTPQMPEGAEADNKKKRREVWAAWWKVNANRVDLGRMSEHALLGYTLICDNGQNRVYEIDRHGKQRWAIDNVLNPLDAVVLPGNRVLIAENQANRVTERDFKGNILWQKKIAGPANVQRLPNGHTFIAGHNGSIVEVDRSGKEIYSIPKVSGNVLGAYRSRRGDIVCLTMDGRCLVLDTTGKVLKELASGYQNAGGSAGNVDMRPNGHLLIARTGDGNQVTELDGGGKIVKEWKVEQALTASPLPNGHLLTVGGKARGIYELDRAGKIVWQHKGGGSFRARRR